MTSLTKCVNNHTKRKEAFHIICYFLEFFEKNIDNPYIYTFIQYNIVIDYYMNNGYILEGIINIINKKKELNDERIFYLIDQNKGNIEYYFNKELVL